jgi:hypothetical protein
MGAGVLQNLANTNLPAVRIYEHFGTAGADEPGRCATAAQCPAQHHGRLRVAVVQWGKLIARHSRDHHLDPLQ